MSELEKEIKWIRETLRLTKKYLNKQEDETRQLLIRLYLLGENQEKIAKLNGYPNVSKMIRDIKKAYRS